MRRTLPASKHNALRGRRQPPHRGRRWVAVLITSWKSQPVDGFTLLEVLLAMGLSAVMLGALWALLSVQVRLFSEDPVQVTRAQLVRSLVQLFSEDLESALPSMPAASTAAEPSVDRAAQIAAEGSADGPVEPQERPTAGSAASDSSSRPFLAGSIADTAADFTTASQGGFGLIGTPETLQFDVLRAVPMLIRSPESTAGNVRRSGEQSREVRSRVPEMFRVTYRFEPPRENRGSAVLEHAGLIRQAWHWETRGQLASDLGASAPPRQPADRAASETVDPYLSSAEDDSGYGDEPGDGSRETDVVPEVVELEFRYFDGTRWSGWWDSQSMGGLPQAVELRMRVTMDEKDHEPLTGLAETEAAGEDAAEAYDEASFFRTVVYLPAARKPDPRSRPASESGSDSVTLPRQPEDAR